MADPGLTGPEPDAGARRVIDTYLAELARQLGGPPSARAEIVAELEDGLWAATVAHQANSLPPADAARAAVAEFGDPRTVAAGFAPELAAATGRRVGLGLLATGPLVGSGWLLLAAATWRWVGREPPAALGLVAALVGWPWPSPSRPRWRRSPSPGASPPGCRPARRRRPPRRRSRPARAWPGTWSCWAACSP